MFHCVLIATGTTLTLYHLRYDFLQVINVTATALGCHASPKVLYSAFQLLCCSWFDTLAEMVFQLVPQVFYRVEVRGCRPPVDFVFLHKICSYAWDRCLVETCVLQGKLYIGTALKYFVGFLQCRMWSP